MTFKVDDWVLVHPAAEDPDYDCTLFIGHISGFEHWDPHKVVNLTLTRKFAPHHSMDSSNPIRIRKDALCWTDAILAHGREDLT